MFDSKTINFERSTRKTSAPARLSVLLLAGAFALSSGCGKQAAEQPAPRSDSQMASDVEARINGEQALSGQNIQVAVNGGTATLSGTANDDASRALAGNEAGAVSGVKTVVNNLLVAPPQMAAAAPIPAARMPKEPLPAAAERKARRQVKTTAATAVPAVGAGAVSEAGAPTGTQQAQLGPQAPGAPQAPVGPQAPVAPQDATAPLPPPLAPMPPPLPEAPAVPVARTVILPEGTLVSVRMVDSLDSENAQTGQTFRATLAADLIADGLVALPQGAMVFGRIVDAKDATHFKGSSLLSIELTGVDTRARQVPVVTDTFTKEGSGRGKNTLEKGAGGAALGALIGGLAGGGRGAAIGAAAGGGAGVGINGVTRGQQVQIPSETLVSFHLQSPVTVTTSRVVGAGRESEGGLQPRPNSN